MENLSLGFISLAMYKYIWLYWDAKISTSNIQILHLQQKQTHFKPLKNIFGFKTCVFSYFALSVIELILSIFHWILFT